MYWTVTTLNGRRSSEKENSTNAPNGSSDVKKNYVAWANFDTLTNGMSLTAADTSSMALFGGHLVVLHEPIC